ncbi:MULTISPECIES: alpha/beta hydrolase [Rhizobium]|uniref:alpha/beta hydrolase n=1 Tax=Rhizobium TaxID=379 RepID=UPI0019810E9B|nr:MULTISPECIES: alpha/beta fold hydrolase [Rhizobium]
MVRKIDVTVPAEGGIDLGAWLFVPEGVGARPAITMAHGFAGTREHGIERFAQAFAVAGFVVLVHDHRNFGTSGGDLRGDIDPWRQVADWRRAISYLEARPEVDPTRIGLWGTSYAGGHALVLGATDRRLRCIVAQVPTISGYEQGLRRISPDALPTLEHAFDEDERAQLRGEPPRRQAVVSADPSVPAAYRSQDAVDFLSTACSRRPLGKRNHSALDTGSAHVRARQLDCPRFADAVADDCRARRPDDRGRSGVCCI